VTELKIMARKRLRHSKNFCFGLDHSDKMTNKSTSVNIQKHFNLTTRVSLIVLGQTNVRACTMKIKTIENKSDL